MLNGLIQILKINRIIYDGISKGQVRLKDKRKGEAICVQHKGYKPYEYYFTPNVYDHYTTKIIAIWRKKIKP